MELMERDKLVLKEVGRWYFMLGRHIKAFCGFPTTNITDRRLRILLDQNYLKREKILYGVPYLYFLTHKSKKLMGYNTRSGSIKVDKIKHDIVALDTVDYFVNTLKVKLEDIVTERQLLMSDGFGSKKHHPDYIFNVNNESYAVEIELTPKAKKRLENNVIENFQNYDRQLWIVERNSKVEGMLKGLDYYNITILYLDLVVQKN